MNALAAIYKLAGTKSYGSLFRDITSGCNNATPVQKQWCASKGYDMVTGFGSPQERSVAAVQRDLDDGYVTPEAAHRQRER